MAKLTRQQATLHLVACELLALDLTPDTPTTDSSKGPALIPTGAAR